MFTKCIIPLLLVINIDIPSAVSTLSWEYEIIPFCDNSPNTFPFEPCLNYPVNSCNCPVKTGCNVPELVLQPPDYLSYDIECINNCDWCSKSGSGGIVPELGRGIPHLVSPYEFIEHTDSLSGNCGCFGPENKCATIPSLVSPYEFIDCTNSVDGDCGCIVPDIKFATKPPLVSPYEYIDHIDTFGGKCETECVTIPHLVSPYECIDHIDCFSGKCGCEGIVSKVECITTLPPLPSCENLGRINRCCRNYECGCIIPGFKCVPIPSLACCQNIDRISKSCGKYGRGCTVPQFEYVTVPPLAPVLGPSKHLRQIIIPPPCL